MEIHLKCPAMIFESTNLLYCPRFLRDKNLIDKNHLLPRVLVQTY